MKSAWTESDRVAALRRYRILDTPAERDFDDIVRLAAEALQAPIAVINLVADDRQWFKAEVGIGARELPLDVSICAHALLEDDMMVVPDTRADARFSCNPLVACDGGLRFYAGALLKTPDNLPIGTICVLDREPRPEGITPFQKLTLEVLARQVMGILELRRALARQREDEKFYRLILESAVDYGIITLDLNGLVTSWNKGATRLLGWSEAEMLGQDCLRFFTPADQADGVLDREMEAALKEGRGIEERWHTRKNGSGFWASGEMLPLTNDWGIPIGFLKVVHDRTEQYLAQRALEASETRTRLALDAAGLGAWESTPDLRELNWDARTRELLGHWPDEVLDYETSFLSRVHPDDREGTAAAVEAAVSPGGSGILDTEYRTISAVDGQTRHIHARGALSQRPDGTQMFIGTVRDVTQEKQAESHLRLLADELQHRIKNTLSVVQAIVSQSLKSASSPEDARHTINERIAKLSKAHDLLRETNWSIAPVGAIVESATRIQGAQQERISFSGPQVLLGARPALALSMALHELCTNAVKYGALSNDTGCVEILWSIEPDSGGREQFHFTWTERGGPTVQPPGKPGFGTRLMQLLCNDLRGTGALEYRAEGLEWHLSSDLQMLCE